MAVSLKKVMVIGLDAPIASRVYKYAMEGKLPSIRCLIKDGVYAENCMVPFPTITPPNWTTIVTGAWPGTHGITCFNVHIPGDPLNKTHQGFDTADCEAEYIWTAAEKVGRKTIIVNWPSTWPPTLKNGIQLGGAGLSMNEWRVGVPAGVAFQCTLAYDQLFTTEEYPQASKIKFKEALGWLNMPKAHRSLEAELKLAYRNARFKIKEKVWHLLVQDLRGEGYDKAVLSKSKDAAEAFASLSVGEWTETIIDRFETEQGLRKGAFRCKLIELSKDAKKFKLYVTPICALEGWSYPESVAKEIQSKEGLPIPYGDYIALNLGWIDPKTFLEVVEMEHTWLGDAVTYILKNKWDMFFMQAHCPDWAYHSFSTKMDPATAKNSEEAKSWQDVELAFYQSLDKMIGRIVSLAGDNTLIIIVSDHGAKATTHRFSIRKVLADAGLLCLKKGQATGLEVVDWSRTKAFPQRSCYIYINLKGRDPEGVVEPGEEYERVRDQVIKTLYEYIDPETGDKPITIALRREDARIIGLHGDRVGDVIYAISANFGGQHGPHLPTEEFSLGSLKGLLIMKGPGIKKNHILKRTVWLTDITPTICYLLDIPIPKDAEGGVIYQALEDPDAKLRELLELRRNYKLLKETYEKEQYLTHTYNR